MILRKDNLAGWLYAYGFPKAFMWDIVHCSLGTVHNLNMFFIRVRMLDLQSVHSQMACDVNLNGCGCCNRTVANLQYLSSFSFLCPNMPTPSEIIAYRLPIGQRNGFEECTHTTRPSDDLGCSRMLVRPGSVDSLNGGSTDAL